MLLASDLFLDWVHLAKTRHSQTEPNRIQAGFAQYYPGCLWKNRTKSESGKLVAGRLSSTRTRPDDFCTVACFQTRCIWPKPDQAIQIGCGLVLHKMIHAIFGRTEPNLIQEVESGMYNPDRFWPHAGHNGHNWL